METDLLDFVVENLTANYGRLLSVAEATGIPYDTLLAIRRRERDPGYSRVKRLADYFRQPAAQVKAA